MELIILENKYIEKLETKIKNGDINENDLVLCDRVALKEKLIRDINNIRDNIYNNKKEIKKRKDELKYKNQNKILFV